MLGGEEAQLTAASFSNSEEVKNARILVVTSNRTSSQWSEVVVDIDITHLYNMVVVQRFD